jgi:hypothetical protein
MTSKLDRFFGGSGRPLTGRQIFAVVGFIVAMAIVSALIVRLLLPWIFPMH